MGLTTSTSRKQARNIWSLAVALALTLVTIGVTPGLTGAAALLLAEDDDEFVYDISNEEFENDCKEAGGKFDSAWEGEAVSCEFDGWGVNCNEFSGRCHIFERGESLREKPTDPAESQPVFTPTPALPDPTTPIPLATASAEDQLIVIADEPTDENLLGEEIAELEEAARKGTLEIERGPMRTACHNNDGRFYEDPDGSYGCILPGGAVVHCTADGSCTVTPSPSGKPVIDTGESPVVVDDQPIVAVDDPVAERATGTGAVIVNTHGCPVDVDAGAADLNSLAASCQETQNGIAFVVSDGGEHVFTQQTGDVQESMANFDEIPATLYAILEQLPAGYGEPVVYCDGYFPGDPGPSNVARMPVYDGNQISYLLGEGETLYCDWFNLPASAAGDVGTPTAQPVENAALD